MFPKVFIIDTDCDNKEIKFTIDNDSDKKETVAKEEENIFNDSNKIQKCHNVCKLPFNDTDMVLTDSSEKSVSPGLTTCFIVKIVLLYSSSRACL